MKILRLQPAGKDYFWGGTGLRDEYGKKIDLIHWQKLGNAPPIQTASVL